jgi:Asp-tRNA(Asn)/Glu-tRNA(Gln) amidotransferase A subunit family amidase
VICAATMANTPLRALGLRQTHEQLASGATDAAGLTRHYLEAIERHNPALNCFIEVDIDGATQAAERSQARWAAGQSRGLFDGIPVALKDNIAVKGWRNSAGLAAWRDRVATADAPVVKALLDAGAVLLGRLNMDEGAISALADNPHFGRCQNPWAEGFTAGGSSGGSAAAVAAGLAVVALGTDTMGSVRIPAAYCGVAGLKPSFGRISSAGVVPVGAQFDVVGPLARRAADLFAMLDLLSKEKPTPAAAQRLPSIGVPQLPDYADCTPAVVAAVEQVTAILKQRGYNVVAFDAAYEARAARRAGFAMMEHELAHYLGDDIDPTSLSPTLARYLSYGAQMSDSKVAAVRQVVADAANTWFDWLGSYELLLMPAVPHEAFPFDISAPPDNQAGLTAPANFTGCPALSLPVGRGADNMPVAVQFIAAVGQESLLAQIAAVVEPEIGANYELPQRFTG